MSKYIRKRLPVHPPAPPLRARPLCAWCSSRMRPIMEVGVERCDRPGLQFERDFYRWSGAYYGQGAFCSVKCCIEYANHHFNHASSGE